MSSVRWSALKLSSDAMRIAVEPSAARQAASPSKLSTVTGGRKTATTRGAAAASGRGAAARMRRAWTPASRE